jgi:hypothetical protein
VAFATGERRRDEADHQGKGEESDRRFHADLLGWIGARLRAASTGTSLRIGPVKLLTGG